MVIVLLFCKPYLYKFVKFFSVSGFQPRILRIRTKDFSSKNESNHNQNGDSGHLLLDVLEGFLEA